METQIQNDVPKFAPVCHVCKSQDETLRDVTFPFVFSIVFMTFRRAFAGVYCKKHRRRYLLLASFITSVFGWLGIPFGFVFTPTVLATLARGSIQNSKANFELLVAVADKKLLTGDTDGAIRCLEESLRFEDNPEIGRRLSILYQTNRGGVNFKAPSSLKQIGGVLVTLFASSIIGITVGILDLLLGDLLSPLYGSNGSLVIAILSWAPFVFMMFLGLLAIQSMVGAYFTRNKLSSRWLAIAFAGAASFTMFYNIAEIQAIIRNITRLIQAFSYSPRDGLFAVRSILSSGTIFLAANNYEFGKLAGIIYIVLVLGGLGLCAYASIMKGLDIVKWQSRLAQIREAVSNREETSLFLPWATLSGMVFITFFAVALLIPGRLVNVEKAFIYTEQAQAQGKANHFEEAMQYFQKSAEIWPDSVLTHSGLGIGLIGLKKYDPAFVEMEAALKIDPDSLAANLFMGLVRIDRGEHREAIEVIKNVAAAQPKWALPHSLLGVLYYQLDEADLSKKEILTAISYAQNDSQANSMLAGYYLQLLDYTEAEKYILRAIKLSNDPSDYFLLARIYMSQNKLTQAGQAIDEAERIGANPPLVSNSRAALAEFRNDYKKAESIISTALKTYPDDPSLLSELSFIHYKSGQFDKAVEDAQKAIEQNPYEGYAYIDLAFAYQAQGNNSDAIEVARKGVAFMPKYDRGHYILGLCYMEDGMKVEAIKELETFLKLYWDRPIAAEEKLKAEQFLQQLK